MSYQRIARFNHNRFRKAASIWTAVLLCLLALSGCNLRNGSNQNPQGEAGGSKDAPAPICTLSDSALPSVSAESAILIEASTGSVIGEKNANEKMSMASTTKIMTALVAIENCDAGKTVSVSSRAVGIEGSSVYLYDGEKLTMADLLFAMLLESANDAAAAIAIEVGGSIEGFAEMMNEKASELELAHTHFTNPHGLDDAEHFTTASDLAKIAAAAMKNPLFREIVSTYKKTIPLNETEGVRLLINHNKMLKGYDGAIGIKTGYTKKSGRCLVSAAEKDGVELICVTLNAPNDWDDHKTMLDHGFSLYESRLLCEEGDFRYTLPIIGGSEDCISVTNQAACRVILPRDYPQIERTVEIGVFAYAPINKGDVVGRLVYTANGVTLSEVPLCAAYSVDRIIYRKSIWEKLTSLFYK